jgi:hypothetical protein
MTDFLVRRDDLRQTETRETPAVALGEGEARLQVEKFALSANNITYAVIGDGLRYWELFPAPDGFGRIPAWGIAEVVESRAPGIAAGLRVFGLMPMSDGFVAQPLPRGDGFEDRAPHRAPLAKAYNRYLPAPADAHEDAALLFRPLFAASLMLDAWLREHDFCGAQRVLLSSASSKTAYGLAHLIAGDTHVVGLTSARNYDFVESLGCYGGVVSYDEIDVLDDTATAFVDLAGNLDVRARVHQHLGGALLSSTGVGLTHWEGSADAAAQALPGPAVAFFFVPTEMERRAQEWGAAGLQQRYVEAWSSLAPRLEDGWVTITRSHGADALRAIYLDLLEGRIDPRRGDVVSI